jgi:hypothetical protein
VSAAPAQIVYRGADVCWDLYFSEKDEQGTDQPINLAGVTVEVLASTMAKPTIVVTDAASGKATACLTSQQTEKLVKGQDHWFQMRLVYSPTLADVFPPVAVKVQ